VEMLMKMIKHVEYVESLDIIHLSVLLFVIGVIMKVILIYNALKDMQRREEDQK